LFSSSSLDVLINCRCDFCGGELLEISKAIKLGQIMIKLGYINSDQLRKALESKNFGENKIIGQVLLDMNVLDESQLNSALSIQKTVSG